MTADDSQLLLEMYRRMVRIRGLEQAATDLFKRGQLKGAATTYIGMEASAVGVCMAMRRGRRDRLQPPRPWPQHREGRRAGADDGRAAGQGDRLLPGPGRLDAHRRLRDRQPGRLPVVGVGHSARRRRRARVPDAWRGPGGGPLHRRRRDEHGQLPRGASTWPSIWKLPVVFVVENNQYARVDQDRGGRLASMTCRFGRRSYGMPGVRVDGFDVLAVYVAATRGRRAGARRRRADAAGDRELPVRGPLRRRAGGRTAPGPRSPQQRKKDPIAALPAAARATDGLRPRPSWTRSTRRSRQEIADALAFAKASPEPDPATALDYIYA